MLVRSPSQFVSLSTEQYAMTQKVGIQFPVILPLFSSPLDPKAINDWIETHASIPKIKDIAAKIAKHINYISFEQFLSQLQITIDHFNKIVTEPYVLVVAGEVGKSDHWVTSLALEQCGLRWPNTIIFSFQVTTYLQENSHIRNILLLDDASYSADHIITAFGKMIGYSPDSILTKEHYHVWIGIPFMTTHAAKKILTTQFFSDMQLLHHTKINMLTEILDEEEKNYLLSEFDYKCSHRTLTYFDHGYPDAFSTLPALEQGWHLLRIGSIMPAMTKLGYASPDDYTPEAWNQKVAELLPQSMPLMPKIIRPYRLLQKEMQNELKIAIQEKKIGLRTNYSIPARLQKAFDAVGIKLDIVPDAKLTNEPKFSLAIAERGLFKTPVKAEETIMHPTSRLDTSP